MEKEKTELRLVHSDGKPLRSREVAQGRSNKHPNTSGEVPLDLSGAIIAIDESQGSRRRKPPVLRATDRKVITPPQWHR